jgi:hypothetical protein
MAEKNWKSPCGLLELATPSSNEEKKELTVKLSYIAAVLFSSLSSPNLSPSLT